MNILIRAARAAAARYRTVPASVLYPQLFLGFGWIRAAVAHSVSSTWWSGQEVLTFLDDSESMRLPVYEPFVDLLVRPLTVLVAVVVVGSQFLVGLGLLLNIRPVAMILLGIFLNTNFIMAGEVDPSVFYVVMGMAVVLWIIWDRATPEKAHRISVRATILAALAVIGCGPFITTLDPAHVIDDPSLVLITLSSLFALSCWMMYGELVDDGGRRSPATRAGVLLPPSDHSAGHNGDNGRANHTNGSANQTNGAALPSSTRGTARPRVSRVGTHGARRSVDPTASSLETDLQELRAASPAEIMDAMDRPIPSLPSKETMSYHEDVDTGFSIRERPDEQAEADGARLRPAKNKPQSIANFEVSANEAPLNWYSVRCHFRVDEHHYEERITVWQAVGFDDAIDLAETEADVYAGQIDGEYLGSCDCFHLPDTAMQASQGSEIYSLVRSSDLDPDTYLRAFFFTGSERSAEV